MRIGLFGDVHGEFEIFYSMLSSLVNSQKIAAAVQVGDFHFSEKLLGHPYLFNLTVPLYFIDGNHEDFNYLRIARRRGDINKWAAHNLHYQTRGSFAEFGGIRAGFIGGALHVDQPQQRKEGNVITNDDVERALCEFSKIPPDLVVSHSCPAGIGVGMQGEPSFAWGVVNYILMAGYNPGPARDYGETQLTRLWEQLPNRPKLWVYGHFHKYQMNKVGDTLFICLPRVDLYHKYVELDTDTLEVRLKNIRL